MSKQSDYSNSDNVPPESYDPTDDELKEAGIFDLSNGIVDEDFVTRITCTVNGEYLDELGFEIQADFAFDECAYYSSLGVFS